MGYLEFFHLKIDYLIVEKNIALLTLTCVEGAYLLYFMVLKSTMVGGGGGGVIPNIRTISSLISEMG